MHHPDDAPAGYEWPRCAACPRELRHTELGRVACRVCQDRADRHLAELPDLYGQLGDVLTPGRGSSEAPVSGASRTPPLPIRLEPLSLMARGGVVTILQTWLVDWHEQLGWAHPRWQGDLPRQLDQVVRALRTNLEWAASSHPAFAEFVGEIGSLVRQCERQVTGERAERRIAVQCSCGGILRVTISTPGARCQCGAQYAREDVLELPLADRMAA